MRGIFICFALIALSQMAFAQKTIEQPSTADQSKDPSIYDTNECPDLLTLSGPVLRNLYQAKDIHLTDIQVLSLANVRFVSETQVDLNEEIVIPVGAELLIEIDTCPSTAGLRTEEDQKNTEPKS